jgi:hypothetical protein
MKESDIQLLVRLAVSRDGVTAFRNNVGTAWAGILVDRDPRSGTVTLKNARTIQFGLTRGSSDLIGWRPTLVTPEMVGRVLAVFTGIEIKSASGRERPDQKNFREQLAAAGGIAVLARNQDEAVGGIREWLRTRR